MGRSGAILSGAGHKIYTCGNSPQGGYTGFRIGIGRGGGGGCCPGNCLVLTYIAFKHTSHEQRF